MADTPIFAAWSWLARTSWQAAVLVAVVAAVHLLLGRWLAPRWRYALWMLVVVRLLMPATPTSPWSIFNLRAPQMQHGAVAPQAPVVPVAPVVGASTTTVTITRTFPNAAKAPTTGAMAPATPASDRFPWLGALMMLWAVGSIMVLGRFVIGYVLLARSVAPRADCGRCGNAIARRMSA